MLTAWETLTRVGLIDRAILASPSMVAGALWKLIANGTLFDYMLISAQRVLAGFFLSAAAAIPLGILLGASRVLKAMLDPVISIIRPLPSLSWIPLSMLWFGIGETQKYSIVFMGTFAPLLVFVTDATLRVDRTLIKAAQNLGASRLKVMWEVLLPGAMPSIVSGLKVTLAIAWACIISAEMVGATDGLGFLIWNAKDWGNISQVITGMLAISATILFLDALFLRFQYRLFPWLRHYEDDS
ncbi:MAG: ABC transporter permease [Gammaproteobacteria bacterium]|nr:ABC transporter permease [Gammaproteobacteria bacterium]